MSRPTPLRVDLACGQNKRPGFYGVDIAKCDGVDEVVDLEQYPWPFEDGSVEELFASHYVEHVSDMNRFMEEVYRVLRPPGKDEYGKPTQGGKFELIVPYLRNVRAFQDPTHKQFISEERFLYYNKEWRVANKLDHYPISCDFDFTYGYGMSPEWASRNEEARAFAIRHYWNVVQDLHCTLWKK